jgi:hypothetical protein
LLDDLDGVQRSLLREQTTRRAGLAYGWPDRQETGQRVHGPGGFGGQVDPTQLGAHGGVGAFDAVDGERRLDRQVDAVAVERCFRHGSPTAAEPTRNTGVAAAATRAAAVAASDQGTRHQRHHATASIAGAPYHCACEHGSR